MAINTITIKIEKEANTCLGFVMIISFKDCDKLGIQG